MKALDTIITIADYENSPVNKGGLFVPPLGVLRNFGVDKDNITDADKEKIFRVYWQSAFDDINAFNPDRPLNAIQYLDLKDAAADETIRDALILQVNELLKNGLVETKNSNQNSTSAFTSNVSPNTRIVSPDQISQDVEDKLQEVQYRDWSLTTENGQLTISLNGINLIVAKTANMIALSSLVFEGIDNTDIKFIGENKIIKLINDTTASARAFKGTWDATDRATATDIDNEFTTNGLALTDGATTLIPANTTLGDTILLTITSDATFPVEELVFDGVNWTPITNNDQEDTDIAAIKARLDAIELKIPEVEKKINDHIVTSDAEFVAIKDRLTIAEKDDVKHTTQLTDHEQRISDNTTGVQTFLDERADYVRVEDLPGALVEEFIFNPTVAAIETGTVVGFTFPSLTTLVDGNVATWKLIDNGSGQNAPSIELRDSHNDGSRTSAIINVNGSDQDITIQGMNNALDIEGLNGNSRNYIVANYVLERVEQIKGQAAGSQIDSIARAAALTADKKAQDAQTTADKKVERQLVQGAAPADFETFTQLKTLIDDDELVALTLATGLKITGRITDAGKANAADPVVIGGSSVQNGVYKFGNISISDQFVVTGGSSIQIFDGQVLSFSKQKTTGAFADRTLFSELAIPKGYAILGGTGGTSTKGSIPATTATQAGHIHNMKADSQKVGANGGSFVKNITLGSSQEDAPTSSATPAITISQSVAHNTSGEVLGAGIEIVAYVYTALKDITFDEMGK